MKVNKMTECMSTTRWKHSRSVNLNDFCELELNLLDACRSLESAIYDPLLYILTKYRCSRRILETDYVVMLFIYENSNFTLHSQAIIGALNDRQYVSSGHIDINVLKTLSLCSWIKSNQLYLPELKTTDHLKIADNSNRIAIRYILTVLRCAVFTKTVRLPCQKSQPAISCDDKQKNFNLLSFQ